MSARFVVFENRGWRFWLPPGEYTAAEFTRVLRERAGLRVEIVEDPVFHLRATDEASPALERAAARPPIDPEPEPAPRRTSGLHWIVVVIVALLLAHALFSSCDEGKGSLAPATMAGALLSEQRHQGGTGR